MSMATPNTSVCNAEEITAYLDSELDAVSLARLEEHFATCASCQAELETQRRLLCELDFALADNASVEMPVNFAQVVAARAQADLSGMRDRRERRRAFRLCVVLAAALRQFPIQTQLRRVLFLSWYWHFVDAVWVIVFTVVYIIGR